MKWENERKSFNKRFALNQFDFAVLKQFKKLIILYSVSTIAYLVYSIPFWISSGWFSGHAFLDFAVGAVKVGSHYHLWYLLSLLYAFPIFWACLTFLKKEWIFPTSVLLWIVKVLSYGYNLFLPDKVKNALLLMDKFPALFNAVFCILPFLLLGTYIRMKINKGRLFKILGFAISFSALCVEAFFLKRNGQFSVSFIFFTFPTAYFLMQLVLEIHFIKFKKLSRILGRVSLIVYCIHPMIVEIIENVLMYSIVRFIIVAVLSTVIGFGLVFIKDKIGVKNYV